MSIVAEQYEPQQESSIQAGDANPEVIKEASEFRPASPSEPEQSQDLLRIFAIDCCPHVVKALATAPDWAHAGVSARELFMTKSSLDRSRVHEPAVPILMKRLNCKYNL